MSSLVFCSQIEDNNILDAGFVAPNGLTYEYVLEVDDDMLVFSDCLGRKVPVDITTIDQVISGFLDARNLMLVPRFPDAYISSDMGC